MSAIPRVAMLLVALCVTACATTSFTSTWKAPDAPVLNPQGRRIAAVYISSDESSRRVAEDVLVRRLTHAGAQGIASYTIIPGSELHSLDEVKSRLGAARVDGVVIMRVVSQEQRISYIPASPMFAPYYTTFSGYWPYGWGAPYEPARVTTDTILSMETLIYSLTRDKLLWAGTSRTVNPADVPKFVDQLAQAVAKQMRTAGLLAAKS